MIPPRLIRRTVLRWQNWRSGSAIRSVFPEFAELDQRHRKCVKLHRKGSTAIYAAKRAAMLKALRRETGIK